MRPLGEIMNLKCDNHGSQSAAFVCQHIARTASTARMVGFHTKRGADPVLRPDAWCSACDARVRAMGGRWVGHAGAELGVQAICSACYDQLRAVHMQFPPE